MILRELPDLPPRPLTRTNAQFRADFYARWGQENAIVSGRARHAEYATLTQTLSIKTARGGSETYAMGKRRLRVDDDSYLILNEGQTYSSVLQGDREAFSFCIFFRPGMADEVLGAMSAPLSQAADEGLHCARRKSQFAEHLRSHDHVVTPVLTQLARDASAGIDHADELEEALQNLLQRMIAAEHRVHTAERLIASVKPATRAELLRRVCWAADFICSNYANPITLDEMAAAASLSKFHLVRLFRQIHSVSPHQFLIKKRLAVAGRLLERADLNLGEVARLAGFGTRWSLFRHLRRTTGESGAALRHARDRSAGRRGNAEACRK